MRRQGLKILVLAGIIGGTALTFKTAQDLRPIPENFHQVASDVQRLQIQARNGDTLSVSYQNPWNVYDNLALHEIPALLQQAFISAEDKRFYQHNGVDWRARFHALWQNLKNLRKVRGASTISEQVVRLLNQRPRTTWSRWLEGWEAAELEQAYSKAEILEFYLNQVPYAAQRRGIVQAARYYFNRDLSTLNPKELLALAVLVRAPSRLDPYRNPARLQRPIKELSDKLLAQNHINTSTHRAITQSQLALEKAQLPLQAPHFIQYARKHSPPEATAGHRLTTTLESHLQQWIQKRLDVRLQGLSTYQVRNGAVLVADHHNGDILAWAVAGNENPQTPGRFINAVTTPRQPGSTLKPFVYAMALEKGWTAATLIDDSPLIESVGHGMHSFRNYNRDFYGPISLRDALGNSLNIPAIRSVRFVGTEFFLQRLHQLGFASLNRDSDYYGDALALGSGEVSLLELVQAYATLANRGRLMPLKVWQDEGSGLGHPQIFSPEISSLVANILSDPEARRLEFGANSVLQLPVQTAVKTGTSSDYRDAWAVGFNHRYVVGVWLGNLDQKPTKGLSGSRGPALLLRSIFSKLNKHSDTRPLYLSPRLIKRGLCVDDSQAPCLTKTEWFLPNTEQKIAQDKPGNLVAPKLIQPTPGLHLARDPRIPDELEAFEFLVAGLKETDTVEWWLDNQMIAQTSKGRYLWPLQAGRHQLQAKVHNPSAPTVMTQTIEFLVK